MTPSPPDPAPPTPPQAGSAPSEAAPSEAAQQVWTLMQAFVETNAPRTRLRRDLGQTLGLGPGRGKVKTLIRLAEHPLSLSEIADALHFDRPYATVIVNHLETHGLVERTLDPQDRRRKVVTLTAAGADVVTTALRVMNTPPAAFDALGPDDLAHLGALLARLADTPPADRPAPSETA